MRFLSALIVAALACASPLHAGVTYDFELETANYTYVSSITLSSSGSSVRSISSASVSITFGSATPEQYGGSTSGTFEWNESARTLDVHYDLPQTTFSMSLTGVVFSGGTASDGLPSGSMIDWSNAGSGAPRFTADGTTYQAPFSSIRYFRRALGEEEPVVPGPAAGFALVGLGLMRRRGR